MSKKTTARFIDVGGKANQIPHWRMLSPPDMYEWQMDYTASEDTVFFAQNIYADYDSPGNEEYSVFIGDNSQSNGIAFDYDGATGIFDLQLISNGELDIFSDTSVYVNAPIVALETAVVVLSENFSGGDQATNLYDSGAVGYKDAVVADDATIDFLNRGLTTLTLSANLAITSFSNIIENSFVTLMIEQTGAGNFNVSSWPANVIWEQGVPSVNKPTGQKFQVRFFYDGTNFYGMYDTAGGGGAGATAERVFDLTTNSGNDFSITDAALGTVADGQVFNIAFNTQNTSSATLNINGEGAWDIYDQYGNDLEGYEIVPYDPLGTGFLAVYSVIRDTNGMGGYLLIGNSGLVPFNEVIDMAVGGVTVVNFSDTWVWSNQSPWGVERTSIFRNGIKLVEDVDFTMTGYVATSITLIVPIDVTSGSENIHVINYR